MDLFYEAIMPERLRDLKHVYVIFFLSIKLHPPSVNLLTFRDIAQK